MHCEDKFVSNGYAYTLVFSEHTPIQVGSVAVYRLKNQYSPSIAEEFEVIICCAGRSYPLAHNHAIWAFNADEKQVALDFANRVIANPHQQRANAADFFYSSIKKKTALLPELGTAAWSSVPAGEY